MSDKQRNGMANDGLDVSVVILTIGRPTLDTAIDSVRRQVTQPREVLLINDSPEQQPCMTVSDLPIREVFTGGGRGIGAGRNLGVHHSTGAFVAYLDDDDLWFPHHLTRAKEWFDAHPRCDLYASRMLMARPDGVQLSAKVTYSGRGSLADFYFGRFGWAARRRGIPVSTWVVRREICDLPMDEELRDRMDVWWLLLQAERGRVIQQSREVTGVWFEDPERTLGRYDIDTLLDWADRLDSIAPSSGERFLIGQVGRLYARRGMRSEWEALMDVVAKRPVGKGSKGVKLLERLLLCIRARQ